MKPGTRAHERLRRSPSIADRTSPVIHRPSRVTAVVLAAGAGRRMGKPKLLLPFRGKPLLAWTLDLVAGLPVEWRLVVLGAQAPEILGALFDPTSITHHSSLITHRALSVTRHGTLWEVLINERWPEGMGSSLALAAQHVQGGMLVFLGDMPGVPREAALAVLAHAGDRPVAPGYRGRRGFPVYLPPHLMPRLRALSGDVGARHLIREDCLTLPVPHPGVIEDIDREEDLTCARPDRWT